MYKPEIPSFVHKNLIHEEGRVEDGENNATSWQYKGPSYEISPTS